jgi:hypothetical protein
MSQLARYLYKRYVRHLRKSTWSERIESRIYYLIKLGEANMSVATDMMDKIDSFKASLSKMEDAMRMMLDLVGKLAGEREDPEVDEAIKVAMMAFDEAKAGLDSDTKAMADAAAAVSASGGDAG